MNMHMSSILMCLGLSFLSVCALRAAGLTCDYIELNGDFRTKEDVTTPFKPSHCESNHICTRTFNITQINIIPYYIPYQRNLWSMKSSKSAAEIVLPSRRRFSVIYRS